MFCLTSFCCVCLNEKESLEHLDNKDIDQIQLFDKLKYCAFENHLMEHKPSYICFKCLQILKVAYDFKKSCRKSNEFLTDYISKLSNLSEKVDIEENMLKVELIDIKECLIFTNMAHTYANVDHKKNTENIEKILKIESQFEVKIEVLENDQIEEGFPQLLVNGIKEEPLDEIVFEIMDINPPFIEETGFSVTEINNSNDYLKKRRKQLDLFLKDSVYNNINRKVVIKQKDPSFKCPTCDTLFPDYFLFDSHVKSQSCQPSRKKNNQVDKVFKCNICQNKFKMKRSLKEHLLLHAGLRENKCNICCRQFTQKAALTRHMVIHKCDGIHKCTLCPKTFYSLSSLKTHMHHHQKIKPFSCPKCDKNFYQQGHLTVHMLTHNLTRNYECKICHRSFHCKSNYKQHLDVHSLKKDYKCEVCSKTFTLKSSYQRHVKGHLGLKQFLCDICSKTYSSRSHLERHMLAHSGEKTFECYLCPKKFKYDSSLLTHIKCHFTSRETCNICSKTFDSVMALKQHQKIHNERRRIHKCPICEKSFFSKVNANNHLLVHSGIRKYICSKCPKTYAYPTDLRRHTRIHHENKTR